MGFRCIKDEQLYNKSLKNTLGLICGRNNIALQKQFENYFKLKCQVVTFDINDINTETQEMNRINAKGLTGYVGDYKNGDMKIRLFGCNNGSINEYDFQQRSTHEVLHAWSEFLPTILKINRDRIIHNLLYRNISGTIYKKSIGNEPNETFGGCYNECMMDILAECAFVGYDNTIINNGVTVDTILRESRDRWYHNSTEGKTFYSGFYDFTRLAIAAFSNDANFSFQKCINNGESIILAGDTVNGKNIFKNDFITGTLCDPFIIMNQFDEIMGEGSYFKFCTESEKIFDAFVNGRAVSQSQICNIVNDLTSFAAKKCKARCDEGMLSKDNASLIFNNVLRIRTEIYEKYHINDKLDTRPVEVRNDRLEPAQLSQLTQTVTRENPGKVSTSFAKMKNFFNNIVQKNREER